MSFYYYSIAAKVPSILTIPTLPKPRNDVAGIEFQVLPERLVVAQRRQNKMACARLHKTLQALDAFFRGAQRAVTLHQILEGLIIASGELFSGQAVRFVMALSHRREHEMVGCEPAYITLHIVRYGIDLLESVSIALRRKEIGHIAIPQARCPTDGRLGATGDDDWRPSRLDRFGEHRNVAQLKDLALIGDVIPGPQLATDLDGFVGPTPTLVHRHTTGLELLGKLAADADAEDEPTFRHDIERRHRLGHDHGWTQW